MNQNENFGDNLTWEAILDPEIKKTIPKLWLKFKPPDQYVNNILAMLYLIIMAIGVLGNVTIIWLFCTTKRLRKPSNYLVMNLAVSDFLMLHKMVIFIYNSLHGGPAAGPLWCIYYGFIGGLSGTSSIMTIAMMSVERYICVSRPLDPSSKMTRARALLIVFFIWVYASVFSLVPFFKVNRYTAEGFLTSCSFDYLSHEPSSRIFVFVFFFAAWCVPLTIVCRCYIGIVMSVHESEQNFMYHASGMTIPDRNVVNQKRIEIKLAKISFGLITLWTISWTPYAIVALIGIFTDGTSLNPFVSMVPALLCKAAAMLDPFIYGLSSRQFKTELFKKLVWFCKKRSLQEKKNMPSFIRRAMSIKSQNLSNTDELAEVSYSDQMCETAFTCAKGEVNECRETVLIIHSPRDNRSNSVKSSSSDNILCNGKTGNRKDSERNNNIGVKRVQIINIPQVYVIERTSDIIKMKTRRSF